MFFKKQSIIIGPVIWSLGVFIFLGVPERQNNTDNFIPLLEPRKCNFKTLRVGVVSAIEVLMCKLYHHNLR